MSRPLSVLAVDDEPPALDELAFLLGQSELAGPVRAAGSAEEALRMLNERNVDLVLLDVAMPGLDGVELARVLARFACPPAVAFVTAHEDHAVEAFDVGAVGYLLKPLDRERLERLLRRVVNAASPAAGGVDPVDGVEYETIALDHAGRTVLAARGDVVLVEAAGDYVRVRLRDGTSHLARVPISVLEHCWSKHGFARVHRGFLVSLRDVSELRSDAGGTSIVVGDRLVHVSRRHLHDLRERLVRQAPRAR